MYPPSIQSRFVQALRRARSRLRGGHVVALSAVAVVAFGLVGLRAVDLPEPRPVVGDGRLRIEVVHPVEPDITPGAPMDVGELVDGFKGVPPPEPPVMDVLWSYEDDWGNGVDYAASPRPAGRRAAGTVDDYARPAPERSSPARALQRWFGFDAPRPARGSRRWNNATVSGATGNAVGASARRPTVTSARDGGPCPARRPAGATARVTRHGATSAARIATRARFPMSPMTSRASPRAS